VPPLAWAAVGLATTAIALLLLLLLRPALTAARGGRILAFGGFFVLPALATWVGFGSHVERSKSTSFCLSCHEMRPYGESLALEDPGYLPAHHFQERRIDRDRACFTCHTTYTMFGDTRAKLNGLRHLYVHYLGEPPEKIALYRPYQNRECLHCHAGARAFEENEMHADVRAELRDNVTSCLECHDQTHDVERLAELPKWQAAP
jgi:nitrate/TMAO reductase-like tetraheme cytochrome c subunit